jgi:hypothetical protein
MIVHVQEIGQIITLIISSKISFIIIRISFILKKHYIGEFKIAEV